MVNALLLHPEDSVAVALRDLAPGETICLRDATLPEVVTREAVPFGHKVAVRPVAAGTQVKKYGADIGLATRDIAPGQHVHTHNLVSVRGAVQR